MDQRPRHSSSPNLDHGLPNNIRWLVPGRIGDGIDWMKKARPEKRTEMKVIWKLSVLGD
jgi:hypothetical protein